MVRGMPLTKKGSFSCKQDTVNNVSVDDKLNCKIERATNDIARASFVNTQGQEQPVPDNIRMEQGDGVPDPAVFNGFLITWVGSYKLFVNDEAYLELNNQNHQSISAPRSSASWCIA